MWVEGGVRCGSDGVSSVVIWHQVMNLGSMCCCWDVV